VTDISAAALPPIQPPMPRGVERHPLYRAYLAHRSFAANNLIRATSWEGFLYQAEQDRVSSEATSHPRYPEFMDWMRANRSGARKCLPSKDFPEGLAFPANFRHWLEGGRW
jgi:hypothetical protein